MYGAIAFLPLVGAVITLAVVFFLRWRMNRLDYSGQTPVSEEELEREKPASVFADVAMDDLDELLGQIECAIDWGFSEEQKTSLSLRVNGLFPGMMTYAVFPVRYNVESMDVLMHFGRVDPTTVRCRFESNAALISRIGRILRGLESSAI
jgi:hypothetical protein